MSASILDIVIIVIQFGCRVIQSCCSKCDWDEFRPNLSQLDVYCTVMKMMLTYCVVENARAISPILIECLIDDIPCIAFTSIVSYFVLDVVLHDYNERSICPCTRGY